MRWAAGGGTDTERAAARTVACASLGAWLLFGLLGVRYAGERAAGALDGALRDLVLAGFGDGVLRVLVLPTDIPVQLGVVAGAVIGFLVARRWRAAVLVAGCPALSVVLVTLALKPLVDRRYGTDGGLVMPSGHTTALACVLVVFVLCLPELTGVLRRWWVLGALLVLVCAGIGQVGLGYHYPTDVLGGVCVALGVVPPCWWLGVHAVTRHGSAERW